MPRNQADLASLTDLYTSPPHTSSSAEYAANMDDGEKNRTPELEQTGKVECKNTTTFESQASTSHSPRSISMFYESALTVNDVIGMVQAYALRHGSNEVKKQDLLEI